MSDWGEPRANRELFGLLERAGILNPALTTRLSAMTGFRNILVHGYDSVDLAILRDVVENRLDDLVVFVTEIRSRLDQNST
jgi:uncharacterized protein YutE (UPF0331/DUF86 family)